MCVAECGLQVESCGLRVVGCGLRVACCGLRFMCRGLCCGRFRGGCGRQWTLKGSMRSQVYSELHGSAGWAWSWDGWAVSSFAKSRMQVIQRHQVYSRAVMSQVPFLVLMLCCFDGGGILTDPKPLKGLKLVVGFRFVLVVPIILGEGIRWMEFCIVSYPSLPLFTYCPCVSCVCEDHDLRRRLLCFLRSF